MPSVSRSVPSTLRAGVLSVAATFALLTAPTASASNADVLVAVQPASESLTRATHGRLMQIIEWTFKAPLTADQRARLSDIVVKEWRDPKDREGLKEWLGIADHIDTLPEAQRPNVREQLLQQILPALRDAAKTDANARWFLGVYEAANRPIAAGNPPLTRQASDALIEMLFFMASQAHGVTLEPGPAERDEMARALVAAWPKLPAERRKEVAGAPLQWAGLRASWDVSSAADRAEVAAQWRKDFPLPQSAAGTASAPLVASPTARQALARLKEIDAWLAQPGDKPAARLLQEADALKPLVEQLRKEPGSKPVADQVAAVEAALRRAGTPAPASPQRPGGSAVASNASDIARRSAALNAMQQSARMQMQFMEQMRMSQFNMIQNLGNSPYRYTNSFGRPY